MCRIYVHVFFESQVHKVLISDPVFNGMKCSYLIQCLIGFILCKEADNAALFLMRCLNMGLSGNMLFMWCSEVPMGERNLYPIESEERDPTSFRMWSLPLAVLLLPLVGVVILMTSGANLWVSCTIPLQSHLARCFSIRFQSSGFNVVNEGGVSSVLSKGTVRKTCFPCIL